MKNLNDNKGFTLLEVLVALTLMTIGILAIVQMQLVAMKSGTIAQSNTVATNIANEVLQDIQSCEKKDPYVLALKCRSLPDNYNFEGVPILNVPVNFLTNPHSNTSRDQTTLFFGDAGTFRAFYDITMGPNGSHSSTASIVVRVEKQRPDGVFENRITVNGIKSVL